MNSLRKACLSTVGCSVLLVANATGQTIEADPTIPPPGQTAVLKVTGKGVQIYACKATSGAPVWTFVAPDAKLEDANGAEVGSHGAGPSWTLNEGGSVQGKMLAQKASPDRGSIPWLLLGAHDAKGPGVLSAVAYIRRSETQGGKPPATGCDAVHLGAETRVPYCATYTFYANSPKKQTFLHAPISTIYASIL